MEVLQGMAFSFLGSSTDDCWVNISLVDPTVLSLVPKTYWLSGAWVFTIDLPENHLHLSNSLACSAFLVTSLHPLPLLRPWHEGFEVCFGQNGPIESSVRGFRAGTREVADCHNVTGMCLGPRSALVNVHGC